MECASARAPSTACGEQQLRSPSPSWSAQSFSVTATTSAPSRAARSAATALSTPPLIATTTRPGFGAASASSPAAQAAARARCRASEARSAAWNFPAERPPSSPETSVAPTRAASSTLRPSTSDTTALPAAIAAPQPSASNVTCAMRPSREHQCHPHEVAAGSAAGAAHVRPGRHGSTARGLHQVLLEGMHPPESRRCAVAQSPGVAEFRAA